MKIRIMLFAGAALIAAPVSGQDFVYRIPLPQQAGSPPGGGEATPDPVEVTTNYCLDPENVGVVDEFGNPCGLASYGIFSGQTVTNTGISSIKGNIAIHPGTSYTGSGTVEQTGSYFLSDETAAGAKLHLTNLYNDLAYRPTSAGGDLTGLELGGMTLTDGVYSYASSAFISAGQTLVLDGQGNPDAVFVFNIGSTFITGSSSNVILINGAHGSNVYYRVGSSATLGTSTNLTGKIVALTSITMTTSASISCGGAFAQHGAVTLDTNTISIC